MKLDSHYINEKLLHILLFTPYNLLIHDFEKSDKFKNLFSLVGGYHIEQIDLMGYEDMESLKIVLDQVKKEHGKTIVAFSNPQVEFLPEILQATTYRFILLVDTNQSVIDHLSEYRGDNLLTYSAKTKTFSPDYNFPIMKYPTFILDYAKEKGLKRAKQQIDILFEYAAGVHKLLEEKKSDELKTHLLKIGPQTFNEIIPHLELLFRTYYEREVTFSENGTIVEKPITLPTYSTPTYATTEEEFGIVEPTGHPEPIISATLTKSRANPTISITKEESILYEEHLNNAKQSLQVQLNKAKQEYKTFIRTAQGVFQRSLNHAIREHAELQPTIVSNPTLPIEMYCELRCKSWSKGIPESVLLEMFSYHVKNAMKSKKLTPTDSAFGTFLEAEQDKYLEAITKLPRESPHLPNFINNFRGDKRAEVEEIEPKPSSMNPIEYVKYCIEIGSIFDINQYEQGIFELIHKKGNG